MKVSRTAWVVFATFAVVVVLAGFLFLPGGIDVLKHKGAPTATPVPSSPTPSAESSPSPNYITAITADSTSATYDGTTLVCVWSISTNSANAVISLGNGSNSRIYFDHVSVTNTGTASAYLSGIRVQTYASSGTVLMDYTISLGTSQDMFFPSPAFALVPNNSYDVSFSQIALQQNPNMNHLDSQPFASFTIVPVWTSTPPT